MEIRYGIEDITQNELNQIKKQVIDNCGFIYAEDIKFFIKDKLPLKNGTLNDIMFKIFGKENCLRTCWGPGLRYEFFEVTNISTITRWEFSGNVGVTSQWSRRKRIR